MIGMPGSGKTTLGRELAKRLGVDFVDIDAGIVESEGMSVAALFAEKGQAWFRALESRALESLQSDPRSLVIATGGGIVEKPENREHMHRAGLVIYIERPLEAIAAAIRFGKDRPLLQTPDDLRRLYERRAEMYRQTADYTVKNERSITDICCELCDRIICGLVQKEE